MIPYKILSKDDSNKIIKILSRELKNIGLYNVAKHGVLEKEKFFYYLTKDNGNLDITSSFIGVFWDLLNKNIKDSSISSYILIKLLDNNEFVDIIKKHSEQVININKLINFSIKNEYEFLTHIMDWKNTLKKLHGDTLKELRKIAINNALYSYVSVIEIDGI